MRSASKTIETSPYDFMRNSAWLIEWLFRETSNLIHCKVPLFQNNESRANTVKNAMRDFESKNEQMSLCITLTCREHMYL